jgi:hypothetical protein
MDKRHTEEERSIVNMFNEYKDFIKDKNVAFVIKKTERIVYAVYMLTKFVPDSDTLHSDLKKTARALLEIHAKFVSTTGISSTYIDQAHAHLQYLSTLLSLAFISGYISSSNIETMKNEINYLHKHIEELSTSFASDTGHLHLKSELFVVNHRDVKPRDVKPREDVSFRQSSEVKPRTKMSFRTTPVGAVPLRPVQKTPTQPIQKEDRESRIIDVIRDKGVVSIKDISTVIFDVSEKTIQRTLQVLIDKGQIKKEGERRWAKYQLV